MNKSAELSDEEVNCLELVLHGKFMHVTSAPAEVEAMVLKGYVRRKPLPPLPMMPVQYNYELTVQGLMLLREYRPQYS